MCRFTGAPPFAGQLDQEIEYGLCVRLTKYVRLSSLICGGRKGYGDSQGSVSLERLTKYVRLSSLT